MLIQERNKELLPEHLRFVEGVVDSEDIPLNVSRETVQSNRVLRAMQKVLAGRVVKMLRELADEKPEDLRRVLGGDGRLYQAGGRDRRQATATNCCHFCASRRPDPRASPSRWPNTWAA